MGLVGAELYCRLHLGLGDPPLYMPDSEVEYLMQPSQTHHRFGNRIVTNAWSMRSDEFPRDKQSDQELRVLVMGDSIVNGGAFTDQSRLATEVMRQALMEALQRPVVIGNISCGSWGPPNLLAYVRKMGLFKADYVVVVVSSDDYGDVPTFQPLGPELPQRRPILALEEAVVRYLPQLLRFRGVVPTPIVDASAADVRTSLDALRELLDLIQLSGSKPLLALHAERSELLDRNYKTGAQTLISIARQRGIPAVELLPCLASCMRNGVEPYRDWAHPNEHGQAAIGAALTEWILSDLGAGSAAAPGGASP